MAQFAHEPAQQVMPFGYWQSDPSFVPSPVDSQGVLNTNEIAVMSQFFTRPDSFADMDEQSFTLSVPPNAKVEEASGDGGFAGFIQSGQVTNQGTTVEDSHMTTYQSNTNQHPQQSQGHVQTDVQFGTDPGPTSEEHTGASTLMTLRGHGPHPHLPREDHLPPTNTAVGWGVMNLQTPPTTWQMNSRPNMPPLFPTGSGWSEQSNYGQSNNSLHSSTAYYGDHMENGGNVNAYGGTGVHLFNGATNGLQQIQQVQQHSQRPSMVQFGSDPRFSHTGHAFPAPEGWNQIQHAKSNNLTSVPLADQASGHMQNFTPASSGRFHEQNGYQGSNYNNLSGLPAHPASYQNTTQGYTGYNFADTSQPYQPRIRPTPNMAQGNSLEVDGREYKPRGPKSALPPPRAIVKQEPADEEGSDYENDVMRTPKSSGKRRKSTTLAASPRSRDDDNDDEFETDDDGEPGSKRKRAKSQGRQNLTDGEKRENHIKSEKMRREFIKNQYESLDQLVPALKGGKSGMSRADVLNEVCDFALALEGFNGKMETALVDRPVLYPNGKGYDKDGNIVDANREILGQSLTNLGGLGTSSAGVSGMSGKVGRSGGSNLGGPSTLGSRRAAMGAGMTAGGGYGGGNSVVIGARGYGGAGLSSIAAGEGYGAGGSNFAASGGGDYGGGGGPIGMAGGGPNGGGILTTVAGGGGGTTIAGGGAYGGEGSKVGGGGYGGGDTTAGSEGG